MLAAGSTLRHYTAFERCPSLAELRLRFAHQYPDFDRLGIHVMASQNGLGEITLGDSHEYDEAIDPFDKAEIDDLILSYLQTFLDVPNVQIRSRWHGTYLKSRDHAFISSPEPGVTIITGFGGAGMTLSFGVAEDVVEMSERPNRPALVVFDMAGTTVEDSGAVNRCFREAFEVHGHSIDARIVDSVMGLAKPLAIRMLLDRNGASAGDSIVDAIHSEFVERMKRYYASSPEVREVPGARELFRELRRRGIKVALDTGFSRDITDVILKRLGWTSEDIDATVASDEVARGRPYPDMIERLRAQLGISNSRLIAKVGDAEADLGEGRNARCGWAIGVSWGTTTRQKLEQFEPDFVVDSVEELRGILLG
jgi:phosphonatase-like hydrolase